MWRGLPQGRPRAWRACPASWSGLRWRRRTPCGRCVLRPGEGHGACARETTSRRHHALHCCPHGGESCGTALMSIIETQGMKQCVCCVCPRSELDLRQKLLQRDERITQLKEQLAERARAMEDLRRRALLPSHDGTGSGSGARASGDELPGLAGRGARPGLRSRSPSPVRVSARTHLVPQRLFPCGCGPP